MSEGDKYSYNAFNKFFTALNQHGMIGLGERRLFVPESLGGDLVELPIEQFKEYLNAPDPDSLSSSVPSGTTVMFDERCWLVWGQSGAYGVYNWKLHQKPSTEKFIYWSGGDRCPSSPDFEEKKTFSNLAERCERRRKRKPTKEQIDKMNAIFDQIDAEQKAFDRGQKIILNELQRTMDKYERENPE